MGRKGGETVAGQENSERWKTEGRIAENDRRWEATLGWKWFEKVTVCPVNPERLRTQRPKSYIGGKGGLKMRTSFKSREAVVRPPGSFPISCSLSCLMTTFLQARD